MCPRQHAKDRFEKLQGCVTHDLDQYMERQVGKDSFFCLFFCIKMSEIYAEFLF